jgi:ABC transporter substrate binding protein (PQQ-dependent alcohol dehydrogenase system)
MPFRLAFLGIVLLCMAIPAEALSQVSVRTAVLRVDVPGPLPLSRLDLPPEDIGFAGGRLATADNATTGGFLGHEYAMLERAATPEDAAAALDALIAEGAGFVAVIAPAATVLDLADHAAGRDVLLFNAAARDGRLRNEDCRSNLLHTAPSRAMLADALAQYLVWKRWTEWLLVHGSHPQDLAKAEAYRRAAARFGAEIAGELEFEDTGGARVSDSGHVMAQRQIPTFMQRAPEHDVAVVADESEVFGAYIPYRTWEPRPVAGDAGLIASTWHWAWEGYGATQLQRRFEKLAGRYMSDIDYQVWLALRTVGEAVTRLGSAEVGAVRDYALSDAFELAGFKGLALSYRPWNHQLRHGVLLADGRVVVSVSPQDEFLHQRTRLDTLGYDAPDSTCRF